MIVVLGSINADLVLSTPHLPQPGETVRATSLDTYPGGKGANQAVAVARLGADVQLVGRVGNDPHGSAALAALGGIDTSSVTIDDDAPTGTALITVAADGQNTIVTSGGANHRVGDSELASLATALQRASHLLVQLEIPMPVVERAVTLASEAGVDVILDPAPVAELAPELLRTIAWITPNEHEAAALGDLSGVPNVAVTLGPDGCTYKGATIPAPSVQAVDTVGCGDAFTGALAVALGEGQPAVEALRFACAAGAAASRVRGASTSMPRRSDVEQLLGR